VPLLFHEGVLGSPLQTGGGAELLSCGVRRLGYRRAHRQPPSCQLLVTQPPLTRAGHYLG